jgi:hypothetical protein
VHHVQTAVGFINTPCATIAVMRVAACIDNDQRQGECHGIT